MASSNPSFNKYRPQLHLTHENPVETPILESAVVGDRTVSSLGKALLYSRWSELTDDVPHADAVHSGGFSRPQNNLSYPCNGPDVYGMVSSILEETNGAEDWNYSQLFPIWPGGNGQINHEEKMTHTENGFPGAAVLNNIYENAFAQMPGDEERLCQGFQDLGLLNSLLVEHKDPDFSCFEPTHAASYVDRTAVKDGSHLETDVQRKEFDCRDMCVMMPRPSYASHNHSNSNNTRLQKELRMEQNEIKVPGGSVEEAGLSAGFRNHDGRAEQRREPSRGFEQRQVHPALWKNASLSRSLLGQKRSKIIGSSWKPGVECPNPNVQSGYPVNGGPYVTPESQNLGCFQPGKNSHSWSHLETGTPAGNSSWYRQSSGSEGMSCPPSSCGRNSSSKIPFNHLLNAGVLPSYPSYLPLTSLDRTPDGQDRYMEGVCRAWPQGMGRGNPGMTFPGGCSEPDLAVLEGQAYSPTVERNRHGSTGGWGDLYKFCSSQKKCSAENHQVRKHVDNSNWFPQARSSVDRSQARYSSQRRKGVRDGTSDPSHIEPSFPVLMLGAKGRPETSQSGMCVSSGMECNSLYPLSPSAPPLPDVADMLQTDGLERSFVSKPLNGKAPPPPLGRNRPPRSYGGPAGELHTHLEVCYEQWQTWEKERRKAEAALARSFPGSVVPGSFGSPVPNLHANPSRVDCLIVDQLREHHMVLTLIGKMERLHGAPVHPSISTALDRHLESIRLTQASRKDELVNETNRQQHGATRGRGEEKDVQALAAAVAELAVLTQKARTALWCALQMSLPRGDTASCSQEAELCGLEAGEESGLGSRESGSQQV